MDKITTAADLLLKVRTSRQRIKSLPDDCLPANLVEAYDVQDALTEGLLSLYGGQQVGYKIACTNAAAQQFLGLDGPFHGPLLSALVYQSPVQLKADDFFMCVIEPEFGFEMGQDLPPTGTAYNREQVTAAVRAVLPAIEIVESRYTGWTTAGAVNLIADQAVHGAWVVGEATTRWKDLDLAGHQMRLFVNGDLNQAGNGSVVLGHPLTALTWLANALNERGRGLEAGQYVTTGVCVDEVYFANAGDVIRADFGSLGFVEVTLTV